MFRVLRNAFLDFRYGGKFLGGTRDTRFAAAGAFGTGNTDYGEMPLLLGNVVEEDDVVVDVGCGRGRVFNWLLSRGYSNEMIGVELDPDVAEDCRRRLRRFRNVRIVTGSILDHIPDNGTVFYLYNPFRENVMTAFAAELKRSYLRNERPIRIVYNNCWLLDIFRQDTCYRISPLVGRLRHSAAVVRLEGSEVKKAPPAWHNDSP